MYSTVAKYACRRGVYDYRSGFLRSPAGERILRHLTWKYFTVFEKVLAIIEELEVDFHVFPNSLAIFTKWTKIRSWHTYQQH